MALRDLGSWMVHKLSGNDSDDGTTAVPARPSPAPLSPVSDLVEASAFEDDMDEWEPSRPRSAAPSHFERYRTLIDSFEEDRESAIEKLVRGFFLLLAYVLPVLVAYAMGKEIGDAYGGAFDFTNGWSLGTHTVAMAGEFALAMMTLSAATALRKMATDTSYGAKFVGSLVSFLLFSLASGLAQWFIASSHIVPTNNSGLVALVFRVAMVPAVDVASLLFLAVMQFKSLKKFVADQRIRAQAIRDINEAELEIQRAQSAAQRRETEERQDLLMKEQRNQVWLELDRLHAQTMITEAKRRASPPDALPAPAADVPMLDQVKVRRIEH
jgi:hypothetical protein